MAWAEKAQETGREAGPAHQSRVFCRFLQRHDHLGGRHCLAPATTARGAMLVAAVGHLGKPRYVCVETHVHAHKGLLSYPRCARWRLLHGPHRPLQQMRERGRASPANVKSGWPGPIPKCHACIGPPHRPRPARTRARTIARTIARTHARTRGPVRLHTCPHVFTPGAPAVRAAAASCQVAAKSTRWALVGCCSDLPGLPPPWRTKDWPELAIPRRPASLGLAGYTLGASALARPPQPSFVGSCASCSP